jgi:hypothetical protein
MFINIIALAIFLYANTLVESKKAASKTATSSNSADAAGIQRFQELTKFNIPVLTLSDKNFSKYVIDKPRIYNAALMFTALGPKYQCDICAHSASQWKEAATYYHNQYNLNTTTHENRIVFFEVDVEYARNIFGQLGIESVPRLIILPPRGEKGGKQKIGDYELNNQEAISRGVVGLLDEIYKKSSVKVSNIIYI